jgi:hypothetical protein
MKKYTVWCRWGPLAGGVPDERDRDWNLVPEKGKEDNIYQWGYKTYEAALDRAVQFADFWQDGFMQTVVREVDLPD